VSREFFPAFFVLAPNVYVIAYIGCIFDFDQLAALYSHKQALSREWEKIGQLIETIDKTIKHLKGQKKMKDKEIFGGFTTVITKAKGGESYFAAEELVLKSVKGGKPDVKTAHDIFKKVTRCIEKELEPTSDEVQRLIKKHHAYTMQFHAATQEVYKALAQLYREHPEFRKQMEPFHPHLSDFMSEAMCAFADQELA